MPITSFNIFVNTFERSHWSEWIRTFTENFDSTILIFLHPSVCRKTDEMRMKPFPSLTSGRSNESLGEKPILTFSSASSQENPSKMRAKEWRKVRRRENSSFRALSVIIPLKCLSEPGAKANETTNYVRCSGLRTNFFIASDARRSNQKTFELIFRPDRMKGKRIEGEEKW